MIKLNENGQCKKSKTTLFFIEGYFLIDKGICKHVSGKDPYRCHKYGVSSQSLCEDHCTSLTTCLAYHYNTKNNVYCSLIPSDKICPSGFYPYYKSGPIAKSISELKADLYSGYVCYGKI